MELLKDWVDEKFEDGLPKLSVNGVSIGHCLMTLYKETAKIAIWNCCPDGRLLEHEAARFADGIFQHTVNSETYNFPQQAWVDTMLMAGYFSFGWVTC